MSSAPASDPPPPALVERSAIALLSLLIFAILTLWVHGRWALSLFQTGILALAAVWAVRMLMHPYRLRGNTIMIPAAGIVLWGVLQLALNKTVYRWETWNSVLNWGVNLVALVLAYQLFVHASVQRRFLRAVLIFGSILAVLSTLQMFSSDKIFWLFPIRYPGIVPGPFVSRNLYAAFMELILPIALLQWLIRTRLAAIALVMGGVIVASVVASASRAGSILAGAEIAVVVALAWTRGAVSWRKTGWLIASFAGVLVLLIEVVGWDNLWNRFQTSDQFAVRRELNQSSWRMFRDRPAWGFGLGTWPDVYPAYALYDDGRFVNQAHNDWAEWAVEGGVPLFLMFGAIALLSLGPAFRSIWGIGVISVFVHCLVDYPLQELPALAAWFFVFLAAVTASSSDPPLIPAARSSGRLVRNSRTRGQR
jgi:O-antigen ligase